MGNTFGIRRLVGGATVALVGASLAAGGSLAAAQGDARRDARVFGLVKACGGPHRFCDPVVGHISARQAGKLVARQRLDGEPAHYSFRLVPGSYTLVVKLRRPGGCRKSRMVQATAHRRTRENFNCALR